MQEWFSAPDLLALHSPLLPASKRSLYRHLGDRAAHDGAAMVRDRAAQGGGREYHIGLLPQEVQDAIRARTDIEQAQKAAAALAASRKEAVWKIYQTASDTAKAEAQVRLAIVKRVNALLADAPQKVAVDIVARAEGVSPSTVKSYYKLITGYDAADWLAALTPQHIGRTAVAECDERALSMLKSDYYRPEKPSFQSCYDRMAEAAAAHGWSPIPSAKTLKRRIEKEVGHAAGIMMRDGRRAAQRLVPSLTRTRNHMTAMEAVNADGHVWDVAVIWDDGHIGRPLIVGFQDVYSGLILSHRIAASESQELIRLALADMVESWGIPQHCYFDNGRAFMSKMLTGRMATRFRFKIKEEDPTGILENLDVKVHPVKPYHGQSKPIERAWRDFADRIAKHPRVAGAYLGNNPLNKPENYRSRAIPIAEFREFVAGEIRRHNLRAGRTSHTAQGRSLWETFRDSYEAPTTLVRRATDAQREFFLLAGLGVSARQPNGEIHLAGNRYWDEALIGYRGRKLMIRFDPDNLHDDLLVYTLAGQPICRATCLAPEGFDSWEAAREIERKRKTFMRKLREVADLHRELTPDQVADLIPDASELPALSAGVTRIVTGNTVRKAEINADPDAFMRGVERMSGEVIRLPEKNRDA
ncbi:MAG: transposase domain-containing protein [Paracoccus sp. (in: a-proteobacteria)]|uniref:transposase domain-containing protein n=1 Tax=Paracoccus sp. TaxID=267 RepID=UPI0026DF38B3|nr:transposase domain-containing protein [Paracoccus sp. (in: a-proteobacteria)]MDO5631109.1 transposase domain-containing protein [Paracoccus sp. (in: a-proteobacteria)]